MKTVIYKYNNNIFTVKLDWTIEKIEKHFCRCCDWFKINGQFNIVFEKCSIS